MTTFTANTDYVCDWETSDFCPADALTSVDAAVAQRAVDAAAEILYGLSGRQFGLCEYTVRPCMKKCCDPCNLVGGSFGIARGSFYRWIPVNVGGLWTNVSCAQNCGDDCSCSEICELRLPGPVFAIEEIKIDGSVVDPTTYRVDNNYSLVRTTAACWPTCQDMSKPDTAVNTFSVKYLKGQPLPAAGSIALTVLANEFAKALKCDDSCALPARVSTITRQGVSWTVIDPQTFLESGRTGLLTVDLWLKSVNPKGRARGAVIASPDFLPPRSTTWP